VLFGDERVLIIEDDSRFLNDITRIRAILEKMPIFHDIILFDHFANVPAETYAEYRRRTVNDEYSEYDDLDSCGCYSLSRHALQRFEKLYETVVIPADNYTSKIPLDGLRKCFSLTNLSCQATYASSMSVSNAGANTIHRVYARSNIIYSNYNMNDGKEYGYGSVIE
jgi:hypothetical protein